MKATPGSKRIFCNISPQRVLEKLLFCSLNAGEILKEIEISIEKLQEMSIEKLLIN